MRTRVISRRMPPTSSPEIGTHFARSIPYWFFATVGLIYASGFLAVTIFLDTFGIREAGTEFWKARYIHIGVICLALPLMLNVPFYTLLYVQDRRRKHARPDPYGQVDSLLRATLRFVASASMLVALEAVVFSFVAFTRPDSTHSPLQVGWIVVRVVFGVIIGLFAVYLFERVRAALAVRGMCNSNSRPFEWFMTGVRLVLATYVLMQARDFFGHHSTLFSEIYARNGLGVILMALFTFVLGIIPFASLKYTQRASDPHIERAVWMLCACLEGSIYYVNVLAFAYTVFPYIPTTRGGGDYTVGPRVVLGLKASQSLPIPTRKLISCRSNLGSRTVPLVLVEESTDMVFVADPTDAIAPAVWRGIEQPKPQVIGFRRDQLNNIHYVKSPPYSSRSRVCE